MAFEKVVLKSGVERGAYIRTRLEQGATTREITAEINSPELYSGPEGKRWADTTVSQIRSKMAPKKDPFVKVQGIDPAEDDLGETDAVKERLDTTGVEVPPEYEDILTPEDIAEIRLDAAKNIRSAARKKARKDMLVRVEQEMLREAAKAAQQGQARGDLVDVSIDLPEYAPGLTLDGVFYCHGTTPRVRRDVAAVLREQVSRAWAHQASISGQKSDFFNRGSTYRAANGQSYARDPQTGGLRV